MPSEKEELEREYIRLILAGAGPITAARGVGSTQRAMAAYVDANIDFMLRVEDAKGQLLEAAEQQAWHAATRMGYDEDGREYMDGEPWAIRFVLESHAPETWQKPSQETVLRIGAADDNVDVSDLHRRLAAAQQAKELSSATEET
jgi:hypothetical protein